MAPTPAQSELHPFAVPFPHAGHGDPTRRFPVLQVPHELVEGLDSVALAVYLRINVWHDRGETYGVDHVVDLIGEAAADRALAELRSHHLLAPPEVMEQLARERRAAQEAEVLAAAEADAVRRRAYLTVPDPWPEFFPGEWSGNRGYSPEEVPHGPVVYWLFEGRKCVYVGSTGDPGGRLAAHWDKPWNRWKARQCADRDSAYWLEAAEIVYLKPKFNRDRTMGGRCALVPKRRPRSVAL